MLLLALFQIYYDRIESAANKLSLLLRIKIQNAQTLQLFTMNIKTESIYKSSLNAKMLGLGAETK